MRGKAARITSVFALLLVVNAAHGKADSEASTSGSALVPVSSRVTANDIKDMDLDKLRQLHQEIGSLAFQLKTKGAGSEPALELPIIGELSKYEVFEAIWYTEGRLMEELRKEPKEISLLIVRECLYSLERNLVPQPVELMDLMQQIRHAGNLVLTSPEGILLVQEMDKILARAESRRGAAAYKLHELIGQIADTPLYAARKLRETEAYLKDRIKGQPEVVDALVALLWKTELFKAARLTPDVIYLGGLPGTGKDTAAEALTDAIWHQDGASKEHMYSMVLKKNEDLWRELGSNTGYIGSENFPPFLDFLINHSGGRYVRKEVTGSGGKTSYAVVQSEAWKGENIPGMATPEQAVVFCNEFHNWTKDNKDAMLKVALEKGYFTINNPNGGLSQIYVPVHFVIASNDGINLVTAREANGERFGKPLTYEQMLEKWQKVHDNKELIKSNILASNGSKNTAQTRGNGATGTSEELLNRIPPRFTLLMRPLSPETIQEIVGLVMNKVNSKLEKESGFFKSLKLTWSDEMNKFIQNYDYIPEDNARPVAGEGGYVDTLVVETILNAIRDGDIDLGFSKPHANMALSIQKNDDGTASLIIHYSDEHGNAQTVTKLIKYTEKDRPADALSPERIEYLKGMPERLKKRVFGIDIIADRLADRIIAIENQRTAAGKESRKASTLVALGLSSTGKTELAKAVAQELTGDEQNLVTIDFSQVQNLHDFKTRILGTHNGQEAIASDFMKAYDRANGNLVVAFDELANVKDPDALTSLYDFFREPIVTTFSDGKPRPMAGVVVIVTGNAGQELYKNVPRQAPMEQQMVAWEEISKQTARDPERQRLVLEKYFPEPLVNRFGKNNIFFFPPHTYKTLKQLTQLKLTNALKRLSNTKSKHGWNLVMPSLEDYTKLVETIVQEGFTLRYQGASIDSYVMEDVVDGIESVLIRNDVPDGTNVVLKQVGMTSNDDEDVTGVIEFKLFVDGRAEPLDFSIRRQYVQPAKKLNKEVQMITGYHEAGHSLVAQAVFPESTKPGIISIIPGVTQIGNDWVMYLGLARREEIADEHHDRDFVIKHIAILAAGYTAEKIVTNGVHTAGKSNDMFRASTLAQDAILRWGLSEKWGKTAIPEKMTTAEYVATLSDEHKTLLRDEVDAFVREGEALAEKSILNNFETFIRISNMLVEQGIVSAADMQKFYKENRIVHFAEQASVEAPTTAQAPEVQGAMAALTGKFRQLFGRKQAQEQEQAPSLPALNGHFRSDIELPKHVANIDEIVLSRKLEQFASVAPPDTPPIGVNQAYEAYLTAPKTCADLLSGLN